MPKLRIGGEPGEVYTNDTGQVLYQLVVDWHNSCGLCAQFDHMVGTSWPIPFHRGCRCKQILVAPGEAALPFTDFREKISELDPHQQSRVIGRANLILVEKGIVGWDDVVTSTRVRDFREVVARLGLKVEALKKAGVNPRIAEEAHQAVHTPAHELAAQQRRDLLQKLEAKGIQRDQVKQALAERLAARVSIGAGPSGPGRPPIVPSVPVPPAPTAGAQTPAPGIVGRVWRKIAASLKVPAVAGGSPATHDLQQAHLASLGVNAVGLATARHAHLARRAREEEKTLRGTIKASRKAEEKALLGVVEAKRKGVPTDQVNAMLLASTELIEQTGFLERKLQRLRDWHEEVKVSPDLIPALPIEERLALYTAGDAKVRAIASLAADHADTLEAMKKIGPLQRQREDLTIQLGWGIKSDRPQLEADLARVDAELAALTARRDAMNKEAHDRLRALSNGPRLRLNEKSHAVSGEADPIGSALRPRLEAALEWVGSVVGAGTTGTLDIGFGERPAGLSQRSYAKGDAIVLRQSAGVPVIVHELGHQLERRAGALPAALDFVDMRTKDQPRERLADAFPDYAYDPDEIGCKDHFDRAFETRKAYYCGKTYGRTSTEIVSMGMEMLYANPVEFALKDPEYCKLILGILDGALR